MTRKPTPPKGWHVFTAGPCKYGVKVDGVPVLYVNDKMIAKAKGETIRHRDALLYEFALSLSAHQAMRKAMFTLYPKLAADKPTAKRYSKELALIVKAMNKSIGEA
jgi:hypothetical protein